MQVVGINVVVVLPHYDAKDVTGRDDFCVCALFNVRSYRLRMSAIPRSCMVLGKLRFLFSSLSLSLSLSFCLFVFRRDLSSEFPPDRPNARVKRVTMER